MHAPTLTRFQSLADSAVAARRGWSGPLGMTMTSAPPEPTPPTPPPAPTPPAPAPPAEAQDDQGRKLGFPVETPVERMKVEEQAAYWRNQSKVQERRTKAWLDKFGDKTPEQIQESLAELQAKTQTEAEQQLAAAKSTGVEEGRKVGLAASAAETAMLLLESYLEHREPDESRRKTLVEFADLSKVVGEDGKVDAARVKTIAEALAPVGDRPGDSSRQRRTSTDVGAGRHGGQSGSGVAAGRDLFAERHGKGGAKDDE